MNSVKHYVMKIHIPYVMYKVDTHVIMIRITVIRTGNVPSSMENTVSERIHYTVVFWMLLVVRNSYDEDGNNTFVLAVVAVTGVDGYSGYLDC
jgi:hypothetical protein